MRVNIWNALDEYTVCMFAGWNRAGSGIKVYHCAFGRHECAVHCGHPEDPAHSKDPLIFFFWKSGLRCISFSWPSPIFFLMFLSCVLILSRTQANTRIQTFYLLIVFDLIPLSVTHLMFYSCKTYSFKRFLCNVPTNLQSLAFLFSCIASWGLSLSLKPGHDVNAAYWRQGSYSRREKVRAIKLIMKP